MQDALTLRNVTKTFPSTPQPILAVDAVSLTIPSGSIFGLLGKNGAGKSTLISLIAGHALPDSGTLTLFGTDIVASPTIAKKSIGLVPQETVTEPVFTVREVLHYAAGIVGIPRNARPKKIDEVLSALSLTEKQHAKARTLSGGQKRRLMVAKALLSNPRFLILDEPTAGVDIEIRSQIWDLVRQKQREGTTILFTTHYLEEAEQLCDHIAFIDRGRILRSDTKAALHNDFSESIIYFTLATTTHSHLPNVTSAGNEFQYPTTNITAGINTLTAHYGTTLTSLRTEKASLEKIFLTITKH